MSFRASEAGRAFLVAVAMAFPFGAWAAPSPDGVWVSAEARRLLEAGATGDPGCYLIISEEEVEESCRESAARWPRATLMPGGSSRATEIRSEGEEVVRSATLRPGAPSELEVRVERGGEREFYRLYRLEERHRPALETLTQVRDRLLGDWLTDDGVSLHFGADGSYRFGGDVGRFRAEGGFETEGGAWAALFFEAEGGGPVRRYLVHGRGERIGLAEVPRDVDLLLPAPEAEELPEEEGEEVYVEGVAIPLPSAAAPPQRIFRPGVEEPAVRIWLRSPVEAVAERVFEDVEEGEEAEEELPAIAQPISPARKCGCSSAEAGLAAGMLISLSWFVRRRT